MYCPHCGTELPMLEQLKFLMEEAQIRVSNGLPEEAHQILWEALQYLDPEG